MTTKIEWTDVTWNPVTGCTKVSAGCKHCYAERMSKRLAGRFGYPADDPFRVTVHPDRLDEPFRWRKPRRVFVCSMGDLFHHEVPTEFIARVFAAMRMSTKHIFQVLTKRPKRMRRFIRTCEPASVGNAIPIAWLGVSVEGQAAGDERIPILLDTPAAVRFVSCEPLLGPMDLADAAGGTYWDDPSAGINWVIVGGETGPGARPMNPDWARSLRDQCADAGIPFFFKQMAKKAPIPDDLMVREWPR